MSSLQYGLYNAQELNVPSGFCNPPTGLAISLNGDIVTFSWVKPHDVFYYKVFIRDAANVLLSTRIVYGTKLIIQLAPGTPYKWGVIAVCDDNPSRESTEAAGPDFTTGAHTTQCVPITVGTVLALPGVNNMTLSWPVVSDALGYVVYYKPKNLILPYETATSNTPTVILPALLSNTTYQFYIDVLCKDGNKYKSDLGYFTTALSPEECSIPVIKGLIKDNSALLSWTAEDVFSFDLFLDSNLIVSAYPGTLITLDNLLAATDYVFSVISKCKNGNSIPGVFNFKTGVAACPSIGTITQNVAYPLLTLSWPAVTGATGYRVNVNGSTEDVILPTIDIPIVPGGTYSYNISTICASGVSVAKAGSYSHPFTCTALTVGEISSTPGARACFLDWANRPGVSTYSIRIKKQVDVSYGAWTDLNVSEVNLTGLLPVTIYDYQIRNNCSDSNTAVYTGSFTTVAEPNAVAPTITQYRNRTSTTVCIDYTIPEGTPVDSFKIAIKDMVTAITTFFDSTSFSYCASSLVPGRLYEFKVAIVKVGYVSVYSAALNVTMCPTCNPVTGLTAALNLTTGALNVSWTGVGADRYDIYTADPTDFNQVYTLKGNTTGTSYSDAANNFALKNVKVVSVYNTCESCAAIVATSCPVPYGLLAVPQSAGALLNWTGFIGAAGYEIEVVEVLTNESSIQSSDQPTLDITQLKPLTEYKWRVKTVCDIEITSNYSPFAAFITEEDAEQGACPLPTFTAILQDSILADPDAEGTNGADNTDPGKLNYFTMYGNGFDRTLTFKDSTNTPIDITGYVFEFLIYNINTPLPVLLSFITGDGTVINGGVTGEVQFVKTAGAMSSLLPGNYEYAVSWTPVGGVRKTMVTGLFVINPVI